MTKVRQLELTIIISSKDAHRRVCDLKENTTFNIIEKIERERVEVKAD